MITTSMPKAEPWQAQGVAHALGELGGVIPGAERFVDLAAYGGDVDDAAGTLLSASAG
jgi:hypothetical protein